jgi:HAMP domain-containing protein
MKPTYKRKILLIDRQFQYRFMIRFSGMVVAGQVFSFLLLAAYYMLRYSESSLTFKFFYISGVAGTGLRETTLLNLILPSLAISIVLTTACTLFMALIYSHRIAGPIYNLKRALREVRNGNLERKIRFRQKDEFHDLAAEVTRTIAWMKKKLKRR